MNAAASSSLERRIAVLEKQATSSGGRGGVRVVGEEVLDVPVEHVCEFATSPLLLGQKIYPTQMLTLKLATARPDLITAVEHELVGTWISGYQVVDDHDGLHYAGTIGTPPDVYERMAWCNAHGRPGFNEIVFVWGRRGGKGMVTAVLALWEAWQLLRLRDPQAHYGLPERKKIMLLVYGTSRETAERDLFGDIVGLLQEAGCFEPFIDDITKNRVRLFTPAQLERRRHGSTERGLIVITASPTVPRSARGAAIKFLALDEAAFIDNGNAQIGTELYRAALPATMQFAGHAMIVLPSTPSSQIGVFWQQASQATAIDRTTGKALLPDRLLLHLPSWSLYEGWRDAHERAMWPDGPNFPRFELAHVEWNEALAAIERADPDLFDNDMRAQWRAVQDAFFSPATITKLFASFQGARPRFVNAGAGKGPYVAHGDPADTTANFPLVIAHIEHHDGQAHVVVDHIRLWRPGDFDDGQIDTPKVRAEMLDYIHLFRLAELTLDSFDSKLLAADLTFDAHQLLGIDTHVERVKANGEEKAERYHLLRRMINEDRVHCPDHILLLNEMRFLQRHHDTISKATSGPVQTDDIVDSLSWLVSRLLGPDGRIHQNIAGLSPSVNPVQAAFDAFYAEPRRNRSGGGSYNPAAIPRWHRYRQGRSY